MLDLSNNDAALTAHGKTAHDFHRARLVAGQRRVYLKRVGDEGRTHHFVDHTFGLLRMAALTAGLKVGPYDFVEPIVVTPRESALFYLEALQPFLPLIAGRDLRPAIDVEWGRAGPRVGRWVTEHATLMHHHTGQAPVIYGSPYFLEACAFEHVVGPLWDADYARNDGREWPLQKLPRPWWAIAAHQYTSNGYCAGIVGRCDLSHVVHPAAIDVNPRKDKHA